jgi:TonB-linked SusC/RagA family outer membrane protein
MVRKARLWLTALVGLAALPLTVLAQERTTITGTVRAGNGAVIPTAQVSVVGTGPSVVTSATGAYRLQVTGAAGSRVRIRASKIGFGMQEVQVTLQGESMSQNFTLNEQAVSLDAVVATGSPTGQATRREVPNAVSTIETAELIDRNPAITTVTAALQSRVPGVQVMTQSGTEGTSPRIRIRGISSINAGSSPIYVIDGVRMNGGSQTIFGVGGASQSASDAVHPADIESMEVIKGPAASTLYGADAANGVISITTKKGRPGQQRVSVFGRVTYGEQEFNGRTFTNYTLCTPARITSAMTGNLGSFPGCVNAAPNTFITSDLLRTDRNALRTGQNRTYSVNATGGGERFGFFLSGNADNNDGVVYNNNFNRISGRSNFTIAPSEKLNVNVNLGYYHTDVRLPLSDNASNGLTRNANRATPGRRNAFGTSWLGLSPTEINQFDNRTSADRFLLSAIVRWQPFSWFQHRVAGGFDYNNRISGEFYERDERGLSTTPACGITGTCPYGATAASGLRSQIRPTDRLYTVDYAGTVETDVTSDLSSTFTFGSQLIASRFQYILGESYGFAPGNVTLLGTGTTNTTSEAISEQRTLGFFAQETVGWRDRLFVTLGLRSDDNSAFGSEFSSVVYPKVGASYVISEEPFFNVPFVDQFRVRAAWGRAGNAPAPYSADQTYLPSTVILGDQTVVQGFVTNSFGNPNLKAETGEEYELGFDGSLLSGRVALDFTYFNKNTNDALIPVPQPPSNGFPGSPNQNVGQINNRGTELTLSLLPVELRNFTWESRINHSTVRNKLVSFGGVRSEPIISGFSVQGTGVLLGEGQPLGTLFGTRPSLDAAGNIRRTAAGAIINEDTVFFGGGVPTRTISWDNNFRVMRNLRFGFQFDQQGGHYQLNLTRRTRTFDRLTREVILLPTDVKADSNRVELLLSGGGAQYIEKADFIKLREVSASYAIPTRFTQRFGSDEVVFSLAARNLRTWTDYSGTDPEVNADNSDFLLAETNAVPPVRRVTASLNVRF